MQALTSRTAIQIPKQMLNFTQNDNRKKQQQEQQLNRKPVNDKKKETGQPYAQIPLNIII